MQWCRWWKRRWNTPAWPPFFSAVFTCTEVGAGKAKPDVYEAARAFLGTPKAQTWVFEDALFAMRTAKASGFLLAAVYDASQAAQQQEIQALVIFTFPPFPRLHTLSEHSVFGQKAVDVQIAQHAFRRNGKKRRNPTALPQKNNKKTYISTHLCK